MESSPPSASELPVDKAFDSRTFARFERLHRRGAAAFVFMLALLIVVIGVQGWRTTLAVRHQRQVQAMLHEMNRLRHRTLDIEAALLTYRSTGNAEMMRERLACAAPCPSGATLAALAADDQEQRERFERISSWERSLDGVLDTIAHADGPVDSVLQQVNHGHLVFLREIRSLLLDAEELELRRLRDGEATRYQQNNALQLLLAGAVMVALAWLLLLWRRSRALIAAGLAAEAAMHALSLRDALTGLANRRALDLHLQRMLKTAHRSGRPLAVLAIDLDNFKPINDAHGHGAGDDVLRELARRMLGTLRESDLVVRAGGDEFVAVLDSLESPATARNAARRLLTALAEPVLLENGELASVTASIGLALYPADGSSPEALLQCADARSYAAKRRGKNQLCDADGPRPEDPPQPEARHKLRRVV